MGPRSRGKLVLQVPETKILLLGRVGPPVGVQLLAVEQNMDRGNLDAKNGNVGEGVRVDKVSFGLDKERPVPGEELE